jgi:hypothetical protein
MTYEVKLHEKMGYFSALEMRRFEEVIFPLHKEK